MCITPNEIYVNKGPIPLKMKVPCKTCWRCRANRVNDYVGRCLCEASTSDWTLVLTLTYAPKPEREIDLAHKILTPKHFQAFVRSLRDANHKIRYLVVGEYGSLKGRAHFHCILFGKGKRPDIPNKENVNISHWPHGHVFADWDADEKALRYACKYLLKNEKGNYWFSLSKKPALGAEFFGKKADYLVECGVLPASFEYLPPNGDRGRPYLLTGASRRDYLIRLIEKWIEIRPFDKRKLSEWVAKGVEKVERYQHVKACEDAVNADVETAFALELEEKRPTKRQIDRALVDTWHIT